jgi:gamma-glutamyltranspeptidase / glutathione hydrolase / leukotriene-C4 hydrolase
MTNTDLLNYSVIVEPALKGTYLGRKVYTTHAPTSCPVLIQMLNLMEHYDLIWEGPTGLNSHRTVKAQKCEI